jgi:hypothetical protein
MVMESSGGASGWLMKGVVIYDVRPGLDVLTTRVQILLVIEVSKRWRLLVEF